MVESPAVKPTGPCRLCGVQASLRCSRCKDEYYCCKEHITSDWKRHKRLCVPAEGVDARPIMLDAILFPADASRPRMIKIPCEVRRDAEPVYPAVAIQHHLDRGEWFDVGRKPTPFVRPFMIGGGAVINLPGPGYNLDIHYDDCFSINGSPFNLCVQALTRGMAPHGWAGNIIGVRHEKPLQYSVRYYNASMQEDLPRFVDFFMQYGTDSYKYDPEAAHKWGGRMKELEY
ncbi:hypothetical protein DAEQUDRAFT_706076 [Daedalea quercina L-15889]|uniref:MYND-type domain-containing protein n=1 Tax=Daedalea quercina L-15889 TaxID=1314783 RepID=A0A165SED9_9APHY|nr:hypothetical protein DAEQUDRAFT_706076 [Daedalea quercina L-15889]